ncbi:MAG: glycosyltransferase [Bacteroidales bacterium]
MSDKPRYLILTLSLEGGGAEKVISRITQSLVSEAEIILVSFYRKGRYLDELLSLSGLKYISLEAEHGNTLSFALRLREIIKKENPDKILSFLYYPNIISYLATLFMRVPLILSERSNHRRYLTRSFKHRVWKLLLRFAYKKSESVVAVSDESRMAIIKDFRVDEDKVFTIRNGLSFPYIDSCVKEKVTEVDLDPGLKYVLAVGSFSRAKNYRLLVESFGQLHSRHKELRLIIIGKGELEDEIRDQVNASGLSNYVIFPGYCNNPYKFMKSAECYVLSSSWEGFPNALIEAMYVNGHVVSTDCQTGPREIITHGKDGLLCPPENSEALAFAIERMCFDQSLRQEVYKESRITIADFDENVMIKKYRYLLTYKKD